MNGKGSRNDRTNPQRTGQTVEVYLQDDPPRERSSRMPALTESSDPVLAELWDNPADAMYDKP